MSRCWMCNGAFDPVRSDQMFCSKRCRVKYYRDRRRYLAELKKKTCPICGKEFETPRSRQVYCNAECRQLSRRKSNNTGTG